MAPPEDRDSLIVRAEEDYHAAEILHRVDDEMTTIRGYRPHVMLKVHSV